MGIQNLGKIQDLFIIFLFRMMNMDWFSPMLYISNKWQVCWKFCVRSNFCFVMVWLSWKWYNSTAASIQLNILYFFFINIQLFQQLEYLYFIFQVFILISSIKHIVLFFPPTHCISIETPGLQGVSFNRP